jgi:DNA helicase-2/ATP-dependent DNA helicase PcrA
MSGYNPTSQQNIVIATADSALIIAGPGTGKTRTAIEKARRHIQLLDNAPMSRVLVLSFSNAAIKRLSDAAGVELSADERRRIEYNTFHSIAASILRAYGRFVALPGRVQVMDTLEEKLVTLDNGWAASDKNYASSAESVGEFWFGEVSKLVI